MQVLTRGADEVQVGLDPRWAVRVDGLDPDEVRLWCGVGPGTDLDALARGAGARAARVRQTVADLAAAGLTRPDPEPGTTVHGPASADADAWSLLTADGDGERQVLARSRAVVGVVGLGATGMAVATHLATAGVGTLLLDDDSPVGSVDVAGGAHRWADVGVPRATAARRVLQDAAPGVRVDVDAAPDVVVVVEHDAADPARATLLMAHGLAHLSVVVRAADTTVGPFVRPGVDPCLHCLDLHRADVDAAWPTVLARLTAGGPDTGAVRRRGGEVGVVAGASAALAAAQVLVHVDGSVPSLTGATVQIALPDVVGRVRDWSAHPDCGCSRLPGPPAPSGP